MNWLLEHYQEIMAIVGQVVAVASAIVVLTPSTKDDEFVGKVVAFIAKFSIFNKRTSV